MYETFTFSRALHMMRYAKAKAKPEGWNHIDAHLFVDDDILCIYWEGEQCAYDSAPASLYLDGEDIMGSWIIFDEN